MPLTHHEPGRRAPDASVLRAAIARAPCSVAELDQLLADAGVAFDVGRATTAWLLKYDLLRIAGDD
jgi:hypothetical protein